MVRCVALPVHTSLFFLSSLSLYLSHISLSFHLSLFSMTMTMITRSARTAHTCPEYQCAWTSAHSLFRRKKCSHHARKTSKVKPVLASCRLVSSGHVPALMENSCASLTPKSVAGAVFALLLVVVWSRKREITIRPKMIIKLVKVVRKLHTC